MPERQVITSLTGTVAPLLTVDTSNGESLDYNSMFLPRDWKHSTPFVIDELPISPLGPSVLNGEMQFEVPKFAHLLMDMLIHTTWPAAIVAPLGNPAYYGDFLGFIFLDYLRINFASNMVYERQMYDLYFMYRQKYGIEHRDAINYLVRGDQSIAQRSADLINGVDTWTDPQLPFQAHDNQAFPIVCVSQKTRFTLKTRALQNLINLPVAGTTATQNGLMNFELWVQVAHLTGNEGNFFVEMSRSAPGISYMIHQNVRQNSDDFASLQNGYIINCKMSGITKPIKYLDWALIPTKLQNDTGRNDMFFFSPQPILGPIPPGMTPYQPIVSWNITANGQIIQRVLLRDYNRVYQHYKMHESPHGEDIFEQCYARYPHAVNAATGYLDYTNLNNPVLSVQMGVGGTGTDPDTPINPQSLRLIINALDYNFWFVKSGNWSRSFN